jgi:GntR family transcriptional regulator
MTTTCDPVRPLGGAGPLWRRLADDLRRRVAEGDFAATFPGELALAAEYAVSRHTVREALRDLRREGLVSAARGKASQVTNRPMIEQPTSALYSLFASVERAGLEQRSVVRRSETRLDPVAAEELGLPADSEMFYLERLRLADGEPLAIDHVWMPADRVRALMTADFGNTSLYRQLSATCGIVVTGGHERVSANVPDTQTRDELGIDAAVAVLTVERLGMADDTPVEWRVTMLRGDRYSMTAQYPSHAGAAPREMTDPLHENQGA